jgi:NAD+ kinase
MSAPARLDRIAFVSSSAPEAEQARAALVRRYGNVEAATADVIVALGGDGLMLKTLHDFMRSGKPIYGMHRGTVGFLMNEYREDGLKERLASAETTIIHPLLMRAVDEDSYSYEFHAINEVSLFR